MKANSMGRVTKDTASQCWRLAFIKSRYHISADEYVALLEKQGGCCAICGTDSPDITGKFKQWCIDHDHACCPGLYTCGKCIRGLICRKCNFALGCARDSTDILEKMLQYLRRWAERKQVANEATVGQ